jgi:hypothetical protein
MEKYTVEETVRNLTNDEMYDNEALKYFTEFQQAVESEIKVGLKIPEEWMGKMSDEQKQIELEYMRAFTQEVDKEIKGFAEKANEGRRLLRENPELVEQMFKEFFQPNVSVNVTEAPKPVNLDKSKTLTPMNQRKRPDVRIDPVHSIKPARV